MAAGGEAGETAAVTFTPYVGTLAYVLDRDRDEVLMIHRNARTDDDHYGKFNGLGGKLEADESVVTGLRREVHEEAGIIITSLALRGTVTWSDFGPGREQWLGFVFLVDGWTGDPLPSNPEGTLSWVPCQRLLQACSDDEAERTAAELPMWAGDRHFVPLVLDGDPRQFHATMPYDGDQPTGWEVERL